MNKIEILKFGFLGLVKRQQSFWIRIAKGSSPEAFELICFIFLGAAPIPYV